MARDRGGLEFEVWRREGRRAKVRTSGAWDHNPAEDEVDAAVETLHLTADQVRKCDYGDASEVQARAKANFVEDNPAVWWFALRNQVATTNYPNSPYLHLPEFIPAGVRTVWLLPDVRKRWPLVYEVDVCCLVALLGECSAFEYYVVGLEFYWLIAENHSDQLILCRADTA